MRKKEIEARLDKLEAEARYWFFQRGAVTESLEEVPVIDILRLILDHLGLRPEIKRQQAKQLVLIKEVEPKP